MFKIGPEVNDIPLWMWFIIAMILLTQSILVYRDAEKRGENKWLWGLFGLLNAPGSGLIYLAITRQIWKKWKRS